MANISFPSILILIGGIMTLVGAFWSGIQSAMQNEQIKQLTAKNTELAEKNIDLVTGGNSYAYYDVGVRFENGINHKVALILHLMGNFPLSDVTIKIDQIIERTNLPTRSFDIETIYTKKYSLITHDLFSSNTEMILLDLNEPNNHFIKITIISRNGEIEQQIRFLKKDNGYFCMAIKVTRYVFKDGAFKRIELLERVDPDYKKQPEWM